MHQLQELIRLHRKGETARCVARKAGMSPNTERRYRRALEAAGLLQGAADELPSMEDIKRAVDEHVREARPPQHRSSLDPWSALIEAKLRAGARPKAIYSWLRLECPDFSGSYSAIKRLCRRLIQEKGLMATDVVRPVQTDPGDVAQVDFGSIGKKWDPQTKRLRQAYVFVMTLGHSRHLFAQITFDQKVDTWLQLHVDAFQFFGGVPRTLVPDNLKAAVIRAAYGVKRQAVLNRSYRELARHYDFIIDPTPPRSPEKKGKVESNIKYVKSNFFGPRVDELDAEILQKQLDRWVVEVAGQRIHGTTRSDRESNISSPAMLRQRHPTFRESPSSPISRPGPSPVRQPSHAGLRGR
ncbi:MAG: IS21 family transposase [Nannocystaceae bacterium]